MPGPITLIGGEGFTEEFTPALRRLKEVAGGDSTRVAVLPTAAAQDGPGVAEQRVKLALSYFAAIGASAEAVMVLDRQLSNDAQMVEKIATATWIHLQGGQPPVLREILDGSAVWEAIKARNRAGALLSGSSAGAMVLGEHAFAPRRPFPPDLKDLVLDPMPGFGLLPGIAVGPHFDAAPPELTEKLRALLPPGVTLVGVDEKTGLLGQEGRWEVIGVGRVTLISDGHAQTYPSGATVPLYHERAPAPHSKESG